MYTVYGDYFATGEGRTLMFLVTRGYGQSDDPRVNAKAEFNRIFHLDIGEVLDGMVWDIPNFPVDTLISRLGRQALAAAEKKAGGLEYHAMLHINFS